MAIGSNSILSCVIACLFMGADWEVATTLFGGFKPLLGEYTDAIVGTILTDATAWLVLVHLRRHRIFLRL